MGSQVQYKIQVMMPHRKETSDDQFTSSMEFRILAFPQVLTNSPALFPQRCLCHLFVHSTHCIIECKADISREELCLASCLQQLRVDFPGLLSSLLCSSTWTRGLKWLLAVSVSGYHAGPMIPRFKPGR